MKAHCDRCNAYVRISHITENTKPGGDLTRYWCGPCFERKAVNDRKARQGRAKAGA